MTENQKTTLIKQLTARLNKNQQFKCPMCGESSFTILDGFFINPIQEDFKCLQFGSNSIPAVSLICSNCGFISQHALGIIAPKIMRGETDESL